MKSGAEADRFNSQAFPLVLKVPNTATRSAMKESRAKMKAGKACYETGASLIHDLEETAKSKRAPLPRRTDFTKTSV